MLNTFPQLLAYGFGSYFFAPLILRVAAAGIFLYLAYNHFEHKEKIARTGFPIVGEGAWIAWVAILVEAAVGIGLVFGYHTQVVAIAGCAIAFKQLFWYGKYPVFFILPRISSILLFVICFSLLITGAGAFAFDLPL